MTFWDSLGLLLLSETRFDLDISKLYVYLVAKSKDSTSQGGQAEARCSAVVSANKTQTQSEGPKLMSPAANAARQLSPITPIKHNMSALSWSY